MFNYLFKLFSNDLGIDLGTAAVLVYVKGQGIVLTEPSVVAMDKETKNVLAIGTEAKKMLGKTPANIIAVRPLRDGVIADFAATEKMIRFFIQKVNKSKRLLHPRIVIGVPSGITEVERRAVRESAEQAGAREVHIIEEPMAAAIGAGIPIQEAEGNMIVYIFASFANVKVSIGAWIYLWAFYFVPLIYISVFVPVPYCLDDCGFVVEPEVRQVDSSSSILLSQDRFGYSRFFVFPYKL